MDPKPRPHHQEYISTLRAMAPAERVMKAFELSAFVKEALRSGIREQFPEASEDECHRIFLERLERCHNRNY
jgi:hypothetical protein